MLSYILLLLCAFPEDDQHWLIGGCKAGAGQGKRILGSLTPGICRGPESTEQTCYHTSYLVALVYLAGHRLRSKYLTTTTHLGPLVERAHSGEKETSIRFTNLRCLSRFRRSRTYRFIDFSQFLVFKDTCRKWVTTGGSERTWKDLIN